MKIYIYIFVSLVFLLTLPAYAQIESPPVIDGEKEMLWDQANYFIPDNGPTSKS